MRKGSGEEGKWSRREVVTKGSDDGLFFCRIVPVASSCFGWACVCVVIGCFGICACRSHCNGCMNVAWAIFWGGSRSTKPCVFLCKVAAADDERHLVCAAVAAAVVSVANCSSYVFCNEWLFLCA